MRARVMPLLMVFAAAGTVLAATTAVLAQSTPPPPATAASPLDPLYACSRITDPTERLACFDRTVAD